MSQNNGLFFTNYDEPEEQLFFQGQKDNAQERTNAELPSTARSPAVSADWSEKAEICNKLNSNRWAHENL